MGGAQEETQRAHEGNTSGHDPQQTSKHNFLSWSSSKVLDLMRQKQRQPFNTNIILLIRYLPLNTTCSLPLSESPVRAIVSQLCLCRDWTHLKLSGECVVCFHSNWGKHWLITSLENTQLGLFCTCRSLLILQIKTQMYTQTNQEANVFFLLHLPAQNSAVLLFHILKCLGFLARSCASKHLTETKEGLPVEATQRLTSSSLNKIFFPRVTCGSGFTRASFFQLLAPCRSAHMIRLDTQAFTHWVKKTGR